MNTVTLHRQVYSDANGARIYFSNGVYYAVDGEIDCSSPDAWDELLNASYFHNTDPIRVYRYVTRGDDGAVDAW